MFRGRCFLCSRPEPLHWWTPCRPCSRSCCRLRKLRLWYQLWWWCPSAWRWFGVKQQLWTKHFLVQLLWMLDTLLTGMKAHTHSVLCCVLTCSWLCFCFQAFLCRFWCVFSVAGIADSSWGSSCVFSVTHTYTGSCHLPCLSV